MQVASNIYQVQLPLPFALRIVNCYLLRGDDGWTVVDSGLHTPDGEAGWQAAFAELAITPRDIRQIVLTHFHPDHYGMAGWLQQQSGGAPVLMSPREAELVAEVWQRDALLDEPMIGFFVEHGTPHDVAEGIANSVRGLRDQTAPHPEVSVIESGSQIIMGGRTFEAIYAPGHSDGQLIFYDAADALMLCGDHLLMKITPHIGLWPESESNPLGRYLASLRELRDVPVRVALSGHRALIDDWHGRVTEMLVHHDQRLDLTLAAVDPTATAYEVSRQIFDFTHYTAHEMRFAIAETLSHLDLLVVQGKLRKVRAETWLYQRV